MVEIIVTEKMKYTYMHTRKQNCCLAIPINNGAKGNLSTTAGLEESLNRRKLVQWKKDIRKKL